MAAWGPLQNHSLQRLEILSCLEKGHIQSPRNRHAEWPPVSGKLTYLCVPADSFKADCLSSKI